MASVRSDSSLLLQISDTKNEENVAALSHDSKSFSPEGKIYFLAIFYYHYSYNS